MKDLNENKINENQLLSWCPRRPSTGLRRRLLRLAGGGDDFSTRWLWSCLAPTMACALLALLAVNRGDTGLESNLPMAVILSSQNNAAYAGAGAQSGENHLASVTFGWTNHSDFRSSIRFTPTTQLTN